MKTQKAIIKSLIARVTTIALFFFIIFLNNSFEYNTISSSNRHVVIIHISNVENTGIPGSDGNSPNLTSSIVSCEISTLNTCNNNNFRIISSTQKAEQLLNKCRLKFIVIKPLLPDFAPIHIHSLASDEIPLIS